MPAKKTMAAATESRAGAAMAAAEEEVERAETHTRSAAAIHEMRATILTAAKLDFEKAADDLRKAKLAWKTAMASMTAATQAWAKASMAADKEQRE